MTMSTNNIISAAMSELGKRSAKKLTKKERSARASKAAQARWAVKDTVPSKTTKRNKKREDLKK